MVNVIKSNGQSQPFDIEKIRRTILRSGVREDAANRIANEVEKKVRDGMRTREIYDMTINILEHEAPAASRRYDLRNAILRLGPAGFDFSFGERPERQGVYKGSLHVSGSFIGPAGVSADFEPPV